MLRNPLATNLHLVPVLKKVSEQGGRVILIDPVQSESATICDRHVQPRVATDASFALALAKIVLEEGLEDKDFIEHHTYRFASFRALLDSHSLESLSDRCGLSIDELRELAREHATTKPASIQLGWGLHKYKSSAEIFRCVDALAALCGQIGIPGGGVAHGYDTQRLFDKTIEASDKAEFHRAIPEPLLGRGLLEASDPPVRMMFVNGGNPVNQSPNSNLVAKALTQLDFVVVVDSFLTRLPGNPVAAIVTAVLFARPLIDAFSGSSIAPLEGEWSVAAERMPHRIGRRELAPGRVVGLDVEGRRQIVKLGRGGSASLLPLVLADGLIDLMAHGAGVDAGSLIRFHPFRTLM
ncbi:molybdopterin-dependent oxidoreductase [Bradyrhizobium canariense]|uniref:molybdopterin-dependent oxidoreductase n=1 Tax=Bradyrhizobium canariense TaxID=255045 RepID=UPI0011BAC1A5|nr:molybdopterin-dependent oxidoreductase [Bradyrhizobium canariense]